ncbi:GatB/YqeY domain-containing protein [Candidatus Microgenomates bacterium]|nr:GatB/YqeY domain-containing protein [Candidatus Microgenomates bacterium]
MLRDDIQKSVNENLKAGKALEVKVLRFLLSEIQYAEIAKQSDLTDEETVALLAKELRKRKEAIEMFKKANRDDLVADEEKQLTVIQKYLPQQLTESELEKAVDEVLSSLPDKSNMGKIIGLVMAKVKGQADGKMVAELVKKKIS